MTDFSLFFYCHYSTSSRITHKKPSTLRIKSKPSAAWNPDLTSSSPVYWPLHHVAVANFDYNHLSTYNHLDGALSFSVEPFRNMRSGWGNRYMSQRQAVPRRVGQQNGCAFLQVINSTCHQFITS